MVQKSLPLGGGPIFERLRRYLWERLWGFIKAKKCEWFNEKKWLYRWKLGFRIRVFVSDRWKEKPNSGPIFSYGLLYYIAVIRVFFHFIPPVYTSSPKHMNNLLFFYEYFFLFFKKQIPQIKKIRIEHIFISIICYILYFWLN
jgi:hypothetical protein